MQRDVLPNTCVKMKKRPTHVPTLTMSALKLINHMALLGCGKGVLLHRKCTHRSVNETDTDIMIRMVANGVTIFIFLAIIKFLSPRKLFNNNNKYNNTARVQKPNFFNM